MGKVADVIKLDIDRYKINGEWKTTEEIVLLLSSSRIIQNPNSQTNVPAPIDINAAISILSQSTAAKLANMPPIVDFVEKSNLGNREGALRWIMLAAKAQIITQEELTGLQQLLSKTIPDPNWTETISLPPLFEVIGPKEVNEAIQEIDNET